MDIIIRILEKKSELEETKKLKNILGNFWYDHNKQPSIFYYFE